MCANEENGHSRKLFPTPYSTTPSPMGQKVYQESYVVTIPPQIQQKQKKVTTKDKKSSYHCKLSFTRF
jgi:hypothetical protein